MRLTTLVGFAEAASVGGFSLLGGWRRRRKATLTAVQSQIACSDVQNPFCNSIGRDRTAVANPSDVIRNAEQRSPHERSDMRGPGCRSAHPGYDYDVTPAAKRVPRMRRSVQRSGTVRR